MAVILMTAAATASGTALWAGIAHAVDLRGFAAVLRAQGVWPLAATRVLPFVVAFAETALGAAGLAMVVLGIPRFPGESRLVFGLMTVLYLAFSLLTVLLRQRSPGAPCGCGGGNHSRANGWTTVRGLVLAGCAGSVVVAGSTPFSVLLSVAGWAEFVLVAAATVAIGTAVWSLPEALAVPDLDAVHVRMSRDV
jgi:hypothetical protein